MMYRFSNIYLGLGGVGLTGALMVDAKEDMAENSTMIVLRGANIASWPNTARYIISGRRRGAKVITIDVCVEGKRMRVGFGGSLRAMPKRRNKGSEAAIDAS
jgi:hypothetical protein